MSLPALELGGFSLGLREGVIGLIGLVGAYIAFVLLRMRHLRPLPGAQAEGKGDDSPVQSPEEPLLLDDDPDPAPDPLALSTPRGMRLAPEGGDTATRGHPAWESTASTLAEQARVRAMQQDMTQLRDEVDALRGELAALRQEMQTEVTHLRAAQSISPIYGDAMQLAVAGYEPGIIAERCGIARAEAELVVALAKSQAR